MFSRLLLTCLLGSLLALTEAALGAEILRGKVVGIADGDTLTLLSPGNIQTRIRLFQIDAPEKSQAFGQNAKASLSELVFGRTIDVRVETHDRYGRTVGTLILEGSDINLEQIRRGMAWVYRQYAKDPAYFRAEEQARQNHVGLWSENEPMPPWVFRHGEKESRSGPQTSSTIEPTLANDACDPHRRCRSIQTCEEAMAILSRCGPGLLDGDHDGIPCESLCNRHHR